MIIKAILLILEVLSSFLLISVILIQKSKGGGLSGAAFGGGSGMGESLFGARAGNVLTRITITLSVFFLCNTLLLAFLYADPEDASLIKDAAAASQEVRPVSAPAPAPVSAPPLTAPGEAPLVGSQPLTIPTEDIPALAPVTSADAPLDMAPGEAPAVDGEITDEPGDL